MQVRIHGVGLFFDVEGAKLVPEGPRMVEKPTLLLLHGGPGADHSIYKPSFSCLAELAQVVYLDHRGNGRSERGDPARWTLAQWGDDVRAFCEALGIEKPIVCGTSFGGYVAMTYAARHPDHPGKLVLVSTSARRNRDRCLRVYERLGGPEAREIAQRWEECPSAETFGDFFRVCLPLYSRAKRDPNLVSRIVHQLEVMWSFGARERGSFDLRPELAKVRCPTLVIGGEDDPVTPIEDQEEIAACLARGVAQFERFPQCGHGVVADDAERFFRVLRAFIAKGGPAHA